MSNMKDSDKLAKISEVKNVKITLMILNYLYINK